MTTEYGIFNAEGCVERDLWSPFRSAATTRRSGESDSRSAVSMLRDGTRSAELTQSQ